MKLRFKNLLNILCIYLLLIDSGGGAKLRLFSLLYIVIHSILFLLNNKKFNFIYIILWVLLIFSLFPSILISLESNVTISNIIPWITALLFSPIIYMFIINAEVSLNEIIYSGLFFSLTIIFIFFGRLMNIQFFAIINDFFLINSNGFFGYVIVNEIPFPNVYFQATLSLVPIAILSIFFKKYLITILLLIALIVSPSRTGFLFVCFYLIANITLNNFSPFKILLFTLLLISLFSFPPIFDRFIKMFTSENEGSSIRIGHLSSIYDFFIKNPINIIFGQGPGTYFYSYGTKTLENNMEISQVEFIRKFGLISFFFFLAFYFIPFLSIKKDNTKPIIHALFFYFLVSFSNPVMYSFFLLILLAISYKEFNLKY